MGRKMMQFSLFSESYAATRIEYGVKKVNFSLHRITGLSDNLCNNTRHASVDLGYHAQPGGLLFMGVW